MRSSLFWSVDVVTIDRARVLRGWTRRELGHEAHLDEGTLCDLFAGRRRPTFGTLRALCGALDLALEDVLVFPHGVAGTMLDIPVSSS
jgi:transcriptional regulator with XRE-family HTH domain